MRMVVTLILIVLTSFGGSTSVAAACYPHMQAVSTGLDHSGHGEASDTICASHSCCSVVFAQTQAAAEQIPLVLSYVPVPNNLPSTGLKPPFRPPIANLSV
ncbi:hypothetical protein [Paracoccus sp. (in: a-proteobacteria)]|uniref:hypothetical protein n=1 Tax=Paracoccus sp. TaxID=267 RepID=UPI002AFE3916|nr:hypothetical protein [Paracoccus sp. (in: a-proteobacteria)]